MKLLVFVFAAIVTYSHHVYACEDDSQFHFNNKAWGTCKWVSQKLTNRCGQTDRLGRKVDEMCKRTCMNCDAPQDSFGVCQDDTSYLYIPHHKWKNCAWAGKQKFRCNKIDRFGNKISDKCMRSCNTCPTPPSTGVTTPTTRGTKSTGEACSSNNECSTSNCSSSLGVCMNSSFCKSLDNVPKGTEFDKDTIIMVFVGSDFTDSTDFSTTVDAAHKEIQSEDMFNDAMAKYRAFYVDKLQKGFCEYGCQGIDRLLCCDVPTARTLANSCFAESSTLQTIVVHNDEKYGGAGYAESNIAVISKDAIGPRLAVHELGHSLFEFGDEYTYGPATAETKANCDVAGCPKWADLDKWVGGGLCKIKACKGGKYFAGRNSFMRNMYMPVGIVNLRFTCCTYQVLTKSMPAYCNQFEPIGFGVLDYCMNDYQGYGRDAYQSRKERELGISSMHEDNVSSPEQRHKIVDEPVVIKLDLESKDFKFVSNSTGSSASTVFRFHHVHGDFQDFKDAKQSGVHNAVHIIQVEFASGMTQEFLFGDVESLVVPPSDPFADISDDENEAIRYVERKEVQLIVEKSRGEITRMEMKTVQL